MPWVCAPADAAVPLVLWVCAPAEAAVPLVVWVWAPPDAAVPLVVWVCAPADAEDAVMLCVCSGMTASAEPPVEPAAYFVPDASRNWSLICSQVPPNIVAGLVAFTLT